MEINAPQTNFCKGGFVPAINSKLSALIAESRVKLLRQRRDALPRTKAHRNSFSFIQP